MAGPSDPVSTRLILAALAVELAHQARAGGERAHFEELPGGRVRVSGDFDMAALAQTVLDRLAIGDCQILRWVPIGPELDLPLNTELTFGQADEKRVARGWLDETGHCELIGGQWVPTHVAAGVLPPRRSCTRRRPVLVGI